MKKFRVVLQQKVTFQKVVEVEAPSGILAFDAAAKAAAAVPDPTTPHHSTKFSVFNIEEIK